ncbi:MAG: hypothetical protein ABR874_04255 [Candidatus Sulfotelmatobacter sp.]
MGLGAILALGNEQEAGWDAAQAGGQEVRFAQSLACVDVLGRSVIERTIENLRGAAVDVVDVLVPSAVSNAFPSLAGKYSNVKVEFVSDVSIAINATLKKQAQEGIGSSFVVSGNTYAETDLLDFFYFHREAKRSATRAFDDEGPLGMWVVDCENVPYFDLEKPVTNSNQEGAAYFIAGYVRRLSHPRDLRALTLDAFRGICSIRPSGEEVRPGIWVAEDAEVDRRARIVAPAYIGCRSRVCEDTLVTRCSSIEKDCYVDYGTVIEDSSILANTRLGIWLDLRHALASGNRLLSLKHDVLLEISDPSVMRFNGALPKEAAFSPRQERQPAPAPQPERTAAAETWQLGANLIQG